MNGLIGALGRINLEFTYYQRKVCFLNNMLYSENCFVYHIMALYNYLHSTNYYVSRLVSAHILVNIIAGVILVISFSLYDALFVVFVVVAYVCL